MRAPPLLLLVIALAGCTSGAPSTEAPAELAPQTSFEETISLLPRGSRELNFEMEASAQLRILLNASAPMDWDLHSHSGDSVQTWEEGADERFVDATFAAPETNVYSVWLKSASSGTTVVRVNLTGTFVLQS